MRRGKLRSLALLLVLMMFAAGLAIFLYPYLWGAMVDREISLNAQGFLNRDATEPTIPEVIVTVDSPTEPEETRDSPELWADMVRYNETIYTQPFPFIRMHFLMRDWSQPLLWRLRPFLFLR